MMKEEFKELGGVGALFLLCSVVIAVPYIVLSVAGPIWAFVAGIGLPVLWFVTMPTTCMSGGLIFSLFGICQMFAGLAWVVIGVVNMVKWIAR